MTALPGKTDCFQKCSVPLCWPRKAAPPGAIKLEIKQGPSAESLQMLSTFHDHGAETEVGICAICAHMSDVSMQYMHSSTRRTLPSLKFELADNGLKTCHTFGGAWR